MSGRAETGRGTDALLDGDAVAEALEQFDTIVDPDRPGEPTAREDGADFAPSDAASDDDTEVARRVEISLVEADEPVVATARRPKLVPRNAEPDLVGIDGDALAWADDAAGSSRAVLAAAALVVLLLGAAGVVFVPHWLERRDAATPTPASATVADVDPIAYRAPKRAASRALPVARPAPGAVAGEPLPELPGAALTVAAFTPAAIFAAPVAPPPAPRPAEPALASAKPAAPAPPPPDGPPARQPVRTSPPPRAAEPLPEGVAPRAVHRVEPVFTPQDAVEQEGSRIVLRVLVDERGAPVRVMVEQGVPGTAGVSKAIDAVLRTRYEAGRRQGEPVRAWLLESFELPD